MYPTLTYPNPTQRSKSHEALGIDLVSDWLLHAAKDSPLARLPGWRVSRILHADWRTAFQILAKCATRNRLIFVCMRRRNILEVELQQDYSKVGSNRECITVATPVYRKRDRPRADELCWLAPGEGASNPRISGNVYVETRANIYPLRLLRHAGAVAPAGSQRDGRLPLRTLTLRKPAMACVLHCRISQQYRQWTCSELLHGKLALTLCCTLTRVMEARLWVVGIHSDIPRLCGGYWLLLRAPRMYSSEQAPAHLTKGRRSPAGSDEKWPGPPLSSGRRDWARASPRRTELTGVCLPSRGRGRIDLQPHYRLSPPPPTSHIYWFILTYGPGSPQFPICQAAGYNNWGLKELETSVHPAVVAAIISLAPVCVNLNFLFCPHTFSFPPEASQQWSSAGAKGREKREIPEKNPPTSGIVRHDSHLRKSRVNRPGIEPGSPRWKASSLTSEPPRPQFRRRSVLKMLGIFPSFEASRSLQYSAAILCMTSSFQDKIDFNRVYTEVTFAIGSKFIKHALDDSAPIADLQGNKKLIPYCQMWGNSGATANEQTYEVRLYKVLWRLAYSSDRACGVPGTGLVALRLTGSVTLGKIPCLSIQRIASSFRSADWLSLALDTHFQFQNTEPGGAVVHMRTLFHQDLGSKAANVFEMDAALVTREMFLEMSSGGAADSSPRRREDFRGSALFSQSHAVNRKELGAPLLKQKNGFLELDKATKTTCFRFCAGKLIVGRLNSKINIRFRSKPSHTAMAEFIGLYARLHSIVYNHADITYSLVTCYHCGSKIDVKHVYTEVDSAIGSQFIRHALDDSEPIADLQGNKYRDLGVSYPPPSSGAGGISMPMSASAARREQLIYIQGFWLCRREKPGLLLGGGGYVNLVRNFQKEREGGKGVHRINIHFLFLCAKVVARYTPITSRSVVGNTLFLNPLPLFFSRSSAITRFGPFFSLSAIVHSSLFAEPMRPLGNPLVLLSPEWLRAKYLAGSNPPSPYFFLQHLETLIIREFTDMYARTHNIVYNHADVTTHWLLASAVGGDDWAYILLRVDYWVGIQHEVSNSAWSNYKSKVNICSILTAIILIGSQDLAVKSRPDLFTLYSLRSTNTMRSLFGRDADLEYIALCETMQLRKCANKIQVLCKGFGPNPPWPPVVRPPTLAAPQPTTPAETTPSHSRSGCTGWVCKCNCRCKVHRRHLGFWSRTVMCLLLKCYSGSCDQFTYLHTVEDRSRPRR
ncbi:hypothetical protein PR048_026260 [Dryococelus australis]|uniref:Uncharacterized protein n=1 Tax=Dryococelus australis TaxID=614101 RepID=A0ABQ9GKV3_9NEOP|nr:hypothetical protein PR048_026260 [Dryococelus australis]